MNAANELRTLLQNATIDALKDTQAVFAHTMSTAEAGGRGSHRVEEIMQFVAEHFVPRSSV